jgi:mannosylglycerate hydrolase
MAMPRRLFIVAHTHWDREWYLPFEGFRMKLVPTIMGILDTLEADPTFPHFMLDGQVAAVDDYLKVRPQDAPRIRALVEQGRLSIGPWYVLMDEFLISGETIIRNLERGGRRALDLGGSMAVGYLPDMFGHIAQMPQILKQFGLDHAVVWRGVPSAVTSTRFTWASPDGSSIDTEYLPIGYSNASQLPQENPEFLERFSDYLVESDSLLGDDVLMMNGGDHLPITRALPQLVAEANAMQDDLLLEITSLESYLSSTTVEPSTQWHGELRSGFRANLLMGVTSNHVGVKHATAAAERALERRAEPLAALVLTASPERDCFLDEAWLHLIHNAAHDSICACSVDEVIEAVLARASAARSIAETIADEALRSFATQLSHEGVTALNLSSVTTSGLVTYTTSGDEAPAHTQVLSQHAGTPGVVTIDAGMMKALLGMLQGPRFGDDAWIQSIEVHELDDGLHVSATIGPKERPNVPIAAAKQEIYARLGARPDVAVHLTLHQPTIYRVLALTGPLAPLSWAPVDALAPRHPVVVGDNGRSLSNGILSLAIADDGSFSINGVSGFGRLVDGGDLGDSYNYSPPVNDSLVENPVSVEIAITEHGLLRSTITVSRTYEFPESADEASHARSGGVMTPISMVITLEADRPEVGLELSWRNLSSDHRLRLHLPTMEPTPYSRAGSAFATVQRGLEAEGRPDEIGLPTFPASHYLQAGRISVAHHGVHEYELVDINDAVAHEIAITLLRSTGMLSRLGMTNRPFPAGPLTPTPGLQLLGSMVTYRCRIGVDVDPIDLAERHNLPLETVSSFGSGTLEPHGQLLGISGAMISSIRRHEGQLEVRLYNPSNEACEVDLGDHRVRSVDLRGQMIEDLQGKFSLGPHRIVTLLVQEA